MKRQRLLITFATIIFILASFSIAGAQDTSPYLVGIWEESSVFEWNQNQLVNPTTRPLDVIAVTYRSDGSIFQCDILSIPANGSAFISVSFGGLGPYGAIKFFAFPQGSRKLDPNAVIGGFQRKSTEPAFDTAIFKTEANLKAVTINSNTVGEFTQIPWAVCREPS
jgi:hypothetical protein